MARQMIPITTHIFAFIRDDSGNIMPQASRIELCINNECLATFVGMGWAHLEQYLKLGSTFYVFKHQKQLRVLNRRFNYVTQTQDQDGADRFAITIYDFCEMISVLYHDHQDWRCECITKELAYWLDKCQPIDPFLLDFIATTTGDRRVY
jgi:hypothetical protein